ncbi:MAG: response regulator [candidate division KSB1 bacterium]|nr:response regulator [candidate division KSB1 bacterium]MDZ7345487.1 response regulator [candidate division KSB1 bacterium]
MAKRVLLVDDDADFLEIHKTILESGGYEVDTAATGQEALEKIRSRRYDLLIADLIMEELDAGFSLVYAVREEEKTRDLPILMLTSAEERTGFRFQLDKDKEWMKVDDFAAKPLSPAELLKRAAKLTENR